MGQRLNIEITNGDCTLANAYYHWSAYTSSAIQLTSMIVLGATKRNESPLELAVKLLECTGAGVNEEEREKINNDKSGRFDGIEFKNCDDRNRGLLSVTDTGIQETRDWEEGRVTIHLDTKTVDFSVYWEVDREEYENDFEGVFDDLPLVEDFTFEGIPFSEFYELIGLVNQYSNGVRFADDTAVIWIA